VVRIVAASASALGGCTMSRYRQLELGIGGVAVLLLAWLTNPWFEVEGDLRGVVTVAFWILAIALVVILFLDRRETGPQEVSISGPAITQFLFHDARAGLIWLPIRVFVGFTWIEASLHKITGTGWLDGGSALAGYWNRAITIPDTGSPPIAFEWYRDFITALVNAHAETWFAPLIAFGELLVGLGLLFGCLTGIAAFFGALMNMSFLLAGSASSNPVLFTLAVGLMIGWRVAGYYGIDRYLLPALGTPWQRGSAVGGSNPTPMTS
jgi:thiosulfate dehydrogenase [quinone] large subunit